MNFSIITYLLVGCSVEPQTVQTHDVDVSGSIVFPEDNSELVAGQETEFRAMASPKEGLEGASAVWYLDGEVACEASEPSTAGYSFCSITPELGNTTVSIELISATGKTITDEINFTVIDPQPPVIEEIMSPESSVKYYTDYPVSFIARISDAVDSPENLTVTWSSHRMGELDAISSLQSNGIVMGEASLTSGTHNLTLEVTNSSGGVTTQGVTVQVSEDNLLPVCVIDQPLNDEMFLLGDTVDFSGMVTDDDIPNRDLTYRWRSSISGSLDGGNPNSDGTVSFSTDSLSYGMHNISLEGKDEMGAGCSSEISIGVGTPPVVSITSPIDGAVFNSGSPINLVGTASDVDEGDENLTVSWVSDVDGEIFSGNPDSSGGTTVNTSSLSVGMHTISLTALDSIGMEASESFTLRINTPPVVDSITLSPNPAHGDDDLSVSSTTTDVDGDTVSVTYEWYTDGTLTSFVTDTISASDVAAGELWTVRATPSDGYVSGNYLEESITISNTEPTLSALTLSSSDGSSAYIDSTVTCSATVSDVDESLTATYSWDHNGTQYSGESLDLSTITVVAGDSIECTASVTDSFGASASASDTLVIDNRAPTITVPQISPSSDIYVGTLLTCSATGADEDGNDSGVTYEWTNDGVVISDQASYIVTAPDATAGDDISCTATIEDALGASASETSSVVSILNTDPSVTGVDVVPNTGVYNDSTLTCAPSTPVDPDLNATESYSWVHNGTEIATTATITLSDYNILPTEGLTCNLDVEDTYGSTASGSSSIIVDNRDPEISDLALSTPTPEAEDVLTCSATITELDGETVIPSYTWEIEGNVVGSADTLDLGSQSVSVGDEIVCTIDVEDGYGGDASESGTATLQNSLPVFDQEAEISPNSDVFTNTELTCSAIGSDLNDGSLALSYEWTNGSNVLGTDATLQLDNQISAAGDSITCTASATDSEGEEITSEASVTVDNFVPTITNMDLTSASGELYNDEVITCAATVFDADETVTPSYSWESNGSSLGNAQTLDLSTTSLMPGDPISCTIDVTDSASASASETLASTVGNRAPTAPTIVISWSGVDPEPTENDDLTCGASSSTDADGETLTYAYEWSSDQGATVSGDTLLSTDTSTGETWTCTVTVSDATEDTVGTEEVSFIIPLSWDNCPATQTLADAQFEFIGETGNDFTGDKVLSAGDVDGDGLGDILVTSPFNNEVASLSGKLYLILASSLDANNPSISLANADFSFAGENASDAVGSSIASGGDVDGDGLSDILIAVPNNDDAGSDAGKVYLILGSSLDPNNPDVLVSAADFSFAGENADDVVGTSISFAGDVDNDGLDDILIGTRNNDDAGSDAGKVYLILGSSLDSNNPDVSLSNADFSFTGENAGDSAGAALSFAEDVDGDGLSDILVGARSNSDAASNSGKVYVILGSSLDSNNPDVSLSTADFSFTGETTNTEISNSDTLSSGDVDNDGLSDILIDNRFNNGGKVYLILGSSLDVNNAHVSVSTADFSFAADSSSDMLGISLDGSGDIDNDGLDDIIIGAPWADGFQGQIYVILGSSLDSNNAHVTASAVADFTFESDTLGGDQTGFGVSFVGDVNGDGLGEVLIGSPYNYDGGNPEPKASLFMACEQP